MDETKESKRVFIPEGGNAPQTERTEATPSSEASETAGSAPNSELLSQVIEKAGPHQEVVPTAEGLINKERPSKAGMPRGVAENPNWLIDALARKPKDIADEAAAYTDMLAHTMEQKESEQPQDHA